MTRDRMPHVGYDEIDDPAVAAVLAAAGAPGEAPLPGEARALAAYREMFAPARTPRPKRSRESIKLLAAAVFGGVVMASGVATAATGGSFLPFHHPTPSQVTTHHGSGSSHDSDQTSTGTDGTDQNQSTSDTSTGTTPDNHGTQVSQVAGDQTTTGQDHGEAVCATASGSRCLNRGLSSATTHGASTATTHGKSTATSHGKRPPVTDGSADPGKSSSAGTASTTHSGGHDQNGVTHRRSH